MTMRVIAGEAKGARLDPGRELDLRPTGAKVREALFSSLGHKVLDADVLDLFAGTGSLGIEALSRGARRAVFVESSPKAAALVERNLKSARLSDRGQVVVAKAESFIESASQKFDLVLMDPPWAVGMPVGVVRALVESDVLSEDAVVAVGLASRNLPIEEALPMAVMTVKRYGDAAMVLLRSEWDEKEGR